MFRFKVVDGTASTYRIGLLTEIPDSYLGRVYRRVPDLSTISYRHQHIVIDPLSHYSERLYNEYLKQNNYKMVGLEVGLLRLAMKDWYPNYEKRLNQWSKSVGESLGLVAGPKLSYRLKDQATIEMRKERERSYGKK